MIWIKRHKLSILTPVGIILLHLIHNQKSAAKPIRTVEPIKKKKNKRKKRIKENMRS